MNSKRIDKLIKFLKEIEKLKFIYRRVYLSDRKRKENDAEHSWHLAMFIILFEKDFPKLNPEKMLKMALIHDLVEIYAGDTFSFDKSALASKNDREEKAAKKLFKLLPADLEREFNKIFREYDERKTPEAKFTQSFDKLLPILQNILSRGKAWEEFRITKQNVEDHKRKYHLHNKKIFFIFQKLISEVSRKNLFYKGKND
jgi:putative hydrolase of HD superfamily